MNSIFENAIGGIIGAIVFAVLGLSVQRLREKRVAVRRIRGRDDKDADEFLALYSTLFPPNGSNYTEEEAADFLGDGEGALLRRHVLVENYYLVAKVRGEVIGFIWACYYPQRQRAIIPYYGIDKSVKEARLGAAEHLLRRLVKLLRRHKSPCRMIVFEVEKPDGTTDAEKRRERIGRIRRFRTVGSHLKLPVTEIRLPYSRPRLSIDDPLAHEAELVLTTASLEANGEKVTPSRTATKSEIVELLDFLYLDCYGDAYPIDDARYDTFREYLRRQLDVLKGNVLEEVPLR